MSVTFLQASLRPYVKVRADFMPDGSLIPLMFKGTDGNKYVIDRILDVRPGASYGAGGSGVRYTIRAGGTVLYLFFDKVRWWIDTESGKFTT